MIAAVLAALAPMLSGPPALVDVFGDAGVERFVGHGELTAGFTRFGELGVFRWPSPGSSDHLFFLDPPEGPGRPDQGGVWGVEAGGEFRWLIRDTSLQTMWEDTPLGIALLTVNDSVRGMTYHVESFVAREPGVLAIRLDLSRTAERPRVYWYGNFAPCTRNVPGLPVADWLLDHQNDFAVFAAGKGDTLVYFRPDDPGPADWERAFRMFEEDRTTGEWSSFGPGVYIACSSDQPIAGYHCGREASPSSAFTAVATGRLQNAASAAGACDAALELIAEPDQGHFFATIYLAAASSIDEAITRVGRAKEEGYMRLRARTVREWEGMTAAATVPASLPDAVRRRCHEAIHTILVCRDARTGAIVRSPSAQPPLALVWPRYGAWVSMALDMAGMYGAAEADLDAALATIREESDNGPVGSMPAATYSDGVPAFPEFIHDIENTGWILWSCLQHARALPGEPPELWLTKVWPRLSLAADYLATWTDARDGSPLHSFDWSTMHDDQQPRTALVAFLGMDAVVKMGAMLEIETPDHWRRRRNELDLWIQLHHLQREGQWALDDEGVFWLTEQARQMGPEMNAGALRSAVRPILDPNDPRWRERADVALGQEPTDVGRLRDAAWMRSGTDSPLTENDLPVPEGPMRDAVEAANYLLAAFGAAGRLPGGGAE